MPAPGPGGQFDPALVDAIAEAFRALTDDLRETTRQADETRKAEAEARRIKTEAEKEEADAKKKAAKEAEDSKLTFAKVKNAFNDFKSAAMQVGYALRSPMDGLRTFTSQVQSQIGSLVGLFNPAPVQQFQFAVDDLYASIGRTLLPVLNNFKTIVRGLGDSIASLTPQGKMMIAALIGAGTAMSVATVAAVGLSAIINSATAGIPALIGVLVGGLTGLGLAMQGTAGMTKLVEMVMRPLTIMLNVVGAEVAKLADGLAPLAGLFEEHMATMGDLAETVGGVLGGVFRVVANVITALAPVVVGLTRGLSMVADIIGTVLGSSLQLVAEIVKATIEPFRAIGVVMAGVQTAIKPAVEAVKAAITTLGDAFAGVAGIVGDLISGVLTDLITEAMPYIQLAAEVFAAVITRIARVIKSVAESISDFLGVQRVDRSGSDTFTAGASEGAALRQTNITSVQSAVAEAQKSAYALGSGVNTPEDRTASAAEAMSARLGEIGGSVERIEKTIAVISEAVGQFAVDTFTGRPRHGHGPRSGRGRRGRMLLNPWQLSERLRQLGGTPG